MNIEKIIINWKTSSAGFLLIIGAVVSLIYAFANGGAPSQTELMAQVTAIFAGVGLLLSRDVDKSTEATNGHEELEDIGERTNK